MLITIDPYYNIDFFNEALNSLQNNKVDYELFIDSTSPFHFYIDTKFPPIFINYDEIAPNRVPNLVSVTRPKAPYDDYRFLRRENLTSTRGFEHHAFNDAFRAMQRTKEGILFHCNKAEAIAISKQYPRRFWFLGKYFNNRYYVFAADSLLIKNHFIGAEILSERKGFRFSTDLEIEFNYKVMRLKDRLIKISETPYLENGEFWQPRVAPRNYAKYQLN